MIKGMYRAMEEFESLRRLQSHVDFRKCVDKLRTAHTQAIAELYVCAPQDLPDRRAYARCLNDIISEFSRTGV